MRVLTVSLALIGISLLTCSSEAQEASSSLPSPEQIERMRQAQEREIKNEFRDMQAVLAGKQPYPVRGLSHPALTLEQSVELAQSAVSACRVKGHRVSALVADRQGGTVVILRDDGASERPRLMNNKKVDLVLRSGVTSRKHLEQSEARSLAAGFRMNERDKVELPGAVPLRINGVLIGALSVSGAPDGMQDEACALVALENIGDLERP